jgi:HK97 family phage prohead protease
MLQFNLLEVKSTSGKDYFIEGYVSTMNPDFVNDIVDELGQKATYSEIINSNITMDEDHSEWRDPQTGKLYDGKKNKYPIAKVTEARLDNVGTWVKAQLNKNHPDFESRILPMIKDKYLHSFSIAYKVKKAFEKVVDNIKYRVIQDLNLANIAITGNPVNKNATFSVALKSFLKMEEDKIKELETLNTELKSKIETLESENLSLKSKVESFEESNKENESKETELKSVSNKVSELEKSVEELKKENAELKSFVESPQLKSIMEVKSKNPNTQAVKPVTMWDMI